MTWHLSDGDTLLQIDHFRFIKVDPQGSLPVDTYSQNSYMCLKIIMVFFFFFNVLYGLADFSLPLSKSELEFSIMGNRLWSLWIPVRA